MACSISAAGVLEIALKTNQACQTGFTQHLNRRGAAVPVEFHGSGSNTQATDGVALLLDDSVTSETIFGECAFNSLDFEPFGL